MKIIKKNEQIKPSIFPFITKCEYCGAELELDESDVHIGSYGLYDYICPCCNKKNKLGDNEYSITVCKNYCEVEIPIK